MYRRLTWVLGVALVLAAGGEFCSAGSVYGPSHTVRASIAASELIVVGRVVGAASVDPDEWNLRISRIRVEECLFGTATLGDTLLVTWHASSWESKEHPGVGLGTSAAGVQLDELRGDRVLYPLRQRDGRLRVWLDNHVRLDEFDRTVSTPENWLEWIRHPVQPDLLEPSPEDAAAPLALIAASSGLDDLDPTETEQKLAAVASFLESHLRNRPVVRERGGRPN